VFAAALAAVFCGGNLFALSLATTSTPAITCSTVAGPGAAANIVIKPLTALSGASTIAVTFTPPGAGLVVTPPSAGTTLTAANQSAGLTYTVAVTSGCVGATTGSTSVQFKAGGTNDITVAVATTVTATASGLAASAVTISCTKSGATYTPGPAQTISVTSAATGGTPFTVDTTTVPPPTWLTVTPTTGGTASSTPVTFTVAAASGCGSFTVGSSNVATLHLLNAPAPDKLVAVTLQIVTPSPLVATPSPATLSYVKGSGTAGYVDVRVSSGASPAPFFAVNTATLPIWLTVDTTTGTAPKNIRFSTTSVADTLAPGTYSTSIYLKVSGYADLAVPISLLINNKPPRLSVAEGTTRNISWTIGSALPAPLITAVSSDSPISYTTSTGGTLAPIISSAQQSGLAYSFGTQINVSFNPLIFAAAQPGSILTGTVTLTWGSPASTIVVTFNVTILSPGATVSGLTPASLPTANAGQTFTVVLTGSGFVPSTDITQKTKVGVVVGGALVADTNIAANIVNASNIILNITVPAVADANLPFAVAGTGGTVVIGICNPAGGTCSIPTGTATLTIGSGPIIQAVTSASAFVQVAPPAVQSVAPYDMLSIFGANFCTSGGTGCSTSQILYGVEDPTTLRYGTSVSPDAAGATQRLLTVTFQAHGSSTVLATAPILFATNGQINLMVPAALATSIGSQVDIVANFGYGSGATMKSSAPFPVNVTATNPGIFTVGSNGQGDGAALSSAYTLIGPANPAGIRSVASDSDTVAIYMTGLGAPDSTGDNANTGGGAWSADCITAASYYATLNALAGSSLTNIDGTIIQSSLLNTGRLPPCVQSSSTNVPTVTIGGVAATVVYAGFVPDTVAGLYQVNATLPASGAGPFTTASGASVSTITAAVQLPVVVTANSVASQTGGNLWVAPRLKVVGPSGAGLTGTVGIPWSTSNNAVVATEGNGTYRYSLSSGLLPSGLTLNALSGAITGTPAANTAGTYTVTVTATDSANVPVKGTVTFSLTVAGGLVVSSTGSAPYTGTFGTANANLTTVAATGGVFPYTYTITAPATLPTGMTIGSSTGAMGITALTPAGTYHVTVTATDSTVGTPLTGTITFDIVVGLHMARTAPSTGTHGTASAISTVSATGNTGTISYSLDATTTALGWVTIDSTTGIVGITTAAPASTSITAIVTATDGTAATGAATAGTGTITVVVATN
jgi:uncharacterized protein (TIGR03437 family)